MIQLEQIKIPVEKEDQMNAIREAAALKLKLKADDISDVVVHKRSIDARRKPEVYYLYTVEVRLASGKKLKNEKLKKLYIKKKTDKNVFIPPDKCPGHRLRPVVAGFGPAGIFAAYILARAGAEPIVIERGRDVKTRVEDVKRFHDTGILDVSSNVQFGEGGAGTFSDGKLVTQKNDRLGLIRFILETFYRFGADRSVLTESRPHVGTDRLVDIVYNLRQEIIRFGGEIRFSCRLDKLVTEKNRITGIKVNGKEEIITDRVILAIGHSARDTFTNLFSQGTKMEAKPFAVGFRVEHPQELISEIQYGNKAAKFLPPANYRLSARGEGLSIYSFCMCPGGYVIDSSSEEGRLCVNGMSYSDRAGLNANSAIVMPVDGRYFDMTDPLGGMKFQRKLENAAFDRAKGAIPQQLWGDFVSGRTSVSYGRFSSYTKGRRAFSNLRGMISEEWDDLYIRGMKVLGQKVPGFMDEEMILSGIESRTSSPVRILRDESMSGSFYGFYPCGEGAGYAGGIVSAAMDGIRVACAVINSYGV